MTNQRRCPICNDERLLITAEGTEPCPCAHVEQLRRALFEIRDAAQRQVAKGDPHLNSAWVEGKASDALAAPPPSGQP